MFLRLLVFTHNAVVFRKFCPLQHRWSASRRPVPVSFARKSFLFSRRLPPCGVRFRQYRNIKNMKKSIKGIPNIKKCKKYKDNIFFEYFWSLRILIKDGKATKYNYVE